MAAENYILRVTAGPAYDPSTHVEIPVNKATPISISSPRADVELNVRVRDFDGLPRGSPASSPYFDSAPHAANQDQYSIAFRFTPRSGHVSAADLQFGNDFDRPIRDRLPPGFNTALNIVRWWIDPGLDGDAYADKPYLYGPALSSFNAVFVGEGELDETRGGLWFDEGGDEDGLEARRKLGAPDGAKERMKWALAKESKEKWVWEEGQTYGLDFFNAYLDFSTFSLRLPGYHLPIMKYWDGQSLRYVLRNRATEEVYLVVNFSIHKREDVGPDGKLLERAFDGAPQPGAAKATEKDDGDHEHDEAKVLEEARRHLGPTHEERAAAETSPDDVD